MLHSALIVVTSTISCSAKVITAGHALCWVIALALTLPYWKMALDGEYGDDMIDGSHSLSPEDEVENYRNRCWWRFRSQARLRLPAAQVDTLK